MTQPGPRYSYLEGDELRNFSIATQMYYEQVARQVYKRDPETGEKLPYGESLETEACRPAESGATPARAIVMPAPTAWMVGVERVLVIAAHGSTPIYQRCVADLSSVYRHSIERLPPDQIRAMVLFDMNLEAYSVAGNIHLYQ